jgi:hypothetical protein
MIKTTRWSPDTCGCTIDIEWDTNDPNVHTHKLVTPCAAHQASAASEVLVENQTKNRAMQAIAEADASLAQVTPSGVIPDLSKLSFSYDADRNLTIVAKGDHDAAKVQQALDVVLGSGKVSLG